MDFENNYEQEIVFQIENDNQDEKQNKKQKRVIKVATDNLKKMVIDRINGKVGDC